MNEIIILKRNNNETPYGFKIQGGSEFSIPLSILNVLPDSIADKAGLRCGDAIVKIGDYETSWMDHSHAKMELIRAGDEIKLTIERNSVDISKVEPTPLSKLKPSNLLTNKFSPQNLHRSKTDLTVDKGDKIVIGSSHNRAPMPFDRKVGTEIDYKSAKPSNWTPGDYIKWHEDNPNENQQLDSKTVLPRGFKSVVPPKMLPQEHTRSPHLKEYKITHLKENWIEPKIV